MELELRQAKHPHPTWIQSLALSEPPMPCTAFPRMQVLSAKVESRALVIATRSRIRAVAAAVKLEAANTAKRDPLMGTVLK